MGRRKRVTAKLVIAPNEILTKVCEPVADGEDVSGIIRDMMHILTNSKNGVGLAAPQAGHLKRIIIVKESDCAYLVMINPSIKQNSGSFVTIDEGCLSYPGTYKPIERITSILANYKTEGGSCVENARFDNFQARIIQHEVDHLNGRCKVGE